MPPDGWQKSITGYQEVGGQNFEITLNPAVSGRATVLKDTNASQPLALYRDITAQGKGVVSAWIRTDNANTGDYDLNLYGDSHSKLALSAGLGGNGFFHYWNGTLVDSGVSYVPNTWYRIQVSFDTVQDKYDLVVFDTADAELLRVNNIAFGTAITNGVDQVKFQTSDTFNGRAYLDDFMLRGAALVEPGVTAGSESTQDLHGRMV